MFRFRHGVSPLALSVKSTASVFWLSGAEAPASSVASASSYRFAENVRVLPVIVTELELIQVKRKIFLADVVVRPDYSTLEQRPEAFDGVGMHMAGNVFVLGVLRPVPSVV
jgi:hypothetical protein